MILGIGFFFKPMSYVKEDKWGIFLNLYGWRLHIDEPLDSIYRNPTEAVDSKLVALLENIRLLLKI